MLGQAAAAVRPGGRLIYATCSSESEENEAVVDAFLAAQPGFRRDPIEAPRFAPFLDDRGDFRTLPPRDRLEAFYAAVLARG
jgi:16S rRNA (cytosine967-C5)-methyltransferase